MSEEAPALDLAKIRAKLHHSIRVARNAAKRATQFQLQKHVRRLKEADSHDVHALKQELAYLKQIQPQVLGMRALSTKLIKCKLLPKPAAQAQHADEFPLLALAQEHGLDPASVDALPKPQTGLEERVFHQVLSSKVLAEEIQTCMQALMALVHPAPAPDTKSSAAEAPVQVKDTKPKKKAREQPPEPEGEYESDDGMGNEGVRAYDADDLDAMVASASESEMDNSDDEALSDSEDMPARKRSRTSPGTSTFLPSLNSGFIPATEGDDWSDAEADYADTGTVKGPAKSTRKNRRGQRERRAYVFPTDDRIWEKKYGRHANHLKLREKEPRAPKARQSKEAAPRAPAGRPAPTPRAPAERPAPTPRAPAERPAPTPRAPAQHAAPAPVHPSWAAKQKAKEALTQAKPQGTKIVFD
ncbi:unnamed protein product [Malassezia sympodialis ATCC 42132]|uniref:uncharacterized protein n=1 Tax=Malassezia sympodialis (strain ATCC 42132) TaxID=1230383 RepID=UPI0002C1F8CB|nr:uncharacterized protein MSY001_0902 [Malassezia sympodialis ATCC 42132]CCU98196.1 unnamed protein product [Malassezia sympodialis ATCC 42132]|eukprot:XP_018739515.1 uncharacterized protein MSY001_0902 [Malassezia sympodialis ATCC 42132]